MTLPSVYSASSQGYSPCTGLMEKGLRSMSENHDTSDANSSSLLWSSNFSTNPRTYVASVIEN